MRNLYSTSVACCVSLPEAVIYLDNELYDDVAMKLFDAKKKICDKCRNQILKNKAEISFPKFTDKDIECLKEICTGETKYTEMRKEKAKISCIKGKSDDLAIHRGESWEAYDYLKVICDTSTGKDWGSVEDSFDLTKYFNGERRRLKYREGGYYYLAF